MGFFDKVTDIAALVPNAAVSVPAAGAKSLGLLGSGRGGGGGGGGGTPGTSARFAFQSEKFDPSVTQQQFQTALGRNANQQEMDFIQRMVEQGNITNFEANEIIQGLPEAQRSRAFADTQALGQMAGQFDQQILGEAEEQIQSTFAKQGRRGSSGRLAAFAEAAGNLARDRNNRLMNFLAPQLQSQAQGFGARARTARGQAIGAADQLRGGQRQDALRIQAANDFQNLLRQQDTRNLQSALLKSGLKLGGAALGGIFGGPPGASVGSSLAGTFSSGLGTGSSSSSASPFGTLGGTGFGAGGSFTPKQDPNSPLAGF